MSSMDQSFYSNCLKAARAQMVHYATAADWEQAQRWRAERHKYPHESHEAAFARLLDSDPEMQALDLMRRQARDVSKGGRPRKHIPTPQQAVLADAEERLSKRALARAYREHTSFERAFVAEIDTPEGAELYRQTRGHA